MGNEVLKWLPLAAVLGLVACDGSVSDDSTTTTTDNGTTAPTVPAMMPPTTNNNDNPAEYQLPDRVENSINRGGLERTPTLATKQGAALAASAALRLVRDQFFFPGSYATLPASSQGESAGDCPLFGGLRVQEPRIEAAECFGENFALDGVAIATCQNAHDVIGFDGQRNFQCFQGTTTLGERVNGADDAFEIRVETGGRDRTLGAVGSFSYNIVGDRQDVQATSMTVEHKDNDDGRAATIQARNLNIRTDLDSFSGNEVVTGEGEVSVGDGRGLIRRCMAGTIQFEITTQIEYTSNNLPLNGQIIVRNDNNEEAIVRFASLGVFVTEHDAPAPADPNAAPQQDFSASEFAALCQSE